MNTTPVTATRFNRFAYQARVLKADAILGYLETGLGLRAATGAGLVSLAGTLSKLPQADRDVIAAAAGQRSPSDETWRQVVQGVLGYRTLDNVLGGLS